MQPDKNYKYKTTQQDRIIELDREDHIKDLGKIFNGNLDFGMHIAERINKAYSIMADQKEFQRNR